MLKARPLNTALLKQQYEQQGLDIDVFLIDVSTTIQNNPAAKGDIFYWIRRTMHELEEFIPPENRGPGTRYADIKRIWDEMQKDDILSDLLSALLISEMGIALDRLIFEEENIQSRVASQICTHCGKLS